MSNVLWNKLEFEFEQKFDEAESMLKNFMSSQTDISGLSEKLSALENELRSFESLIDPLKQQKIKITNKKIK